MNGPQLITLTIRKNGSNLFQAIETAADQEISISGICQLNAAQYLEVFASSSPSAGTTSSVTERNILSIFRIG